MANISVRKIDDEVYNRLKIRASNHGVSIEEEVRQILKWAVYAPDRLGEFATKCFGTAHGIELELMPQEPHEPMDFKE